MRRRRIFDRRGRHSRGVFDEILVLEASDSGPSGTLEEAATRKSPAAGPGLS
jgi:hypothetical protein